MAFRFSLRLCCLLGIAALVFASVPALAASITLGPGVERIQPFRKSAQTKYWVSRADCLADDKFEFTTTASSDTLGATLEVWANDGSVDCANDTVARSATGTCWKVYSATIQSATAQTIQIRARDIAAGAPGDKVNQGTVENCTAKTSSTSAVPITLYFVIYRGTAVQGTPAVYSNISLDLAGPPPPAGVSAQGAGNLIKVEWTANSDVDVAGFTFFCDPAMGQDTSGVSYPDGSTNATPTQCADASATAAVDASSAADGDTDEGGTDATTTPPAATSPDAACGAQTTGNSGASCRASEIVAGLVPTPEFIASHRCFATTLTGGIDVGRSPTSHTIAGLTNGKGYTVAMASVDTAENVGPLSTTTCAVPEPVKGFLEGYREAGGTAGGGFCSMGHGSASAAGQGLWLAGMAFAASALRRRRCGGKAL